MAKIVTFGELLMRLSTPGNQRFMHANRFDMLFGGAEANVAASLAMFGHDAEFVTRLPENLLAENAIGSLRRAGVKTDSIVRGGTRIGVYFLETGAANRPSGVIYDRSGSSFADASADDFDFEKILQGADLFHISGITPAVSDGGAVLAESALKAARQLGVKVSFDINFRRKLWTVEKAASVLPRLAEYADICFANSWDAANLLAADVSDDAPFEEGAKKLSEKYGFEYVAASLRKSRSASANDYSAMIYSRSENVVYHSREYAADPIVDRVGTGDAFSAGVLCGLLDGKDYRDALEFGVAAAVLKHTVPGDFNCITRGEAEALAGGCGSLKVQR
ncbi:MAG: sugar kinase [Clostridiales bacterium]|nr:sugar kinase [Clostridiales bacterium]